MASPEQIREHWDNSRMPAIEATHRLTKLVEKIQHYYTRTDPTIGELLELKAKLDEFATLFRNEDYVDIWCNSFVAEILEVTNEVS